MAPVDESVSRALRAVPTAPRRPGPRARKLIFGYGTKLKVFGIVGGIFMLVGVPAVVGFARQVPSDLAIALTGRSATARVLVAELDQSITINERHPTEVRFTYSIDGQDYEARSSAVEDRLLRLEPGGEVEIEVASLHPAWARVVGTARSWSGYFGLFALIFPFIGGTLLGAAVRSRRRAIRAFTFGTPVVARVVQAGLDTSVEINGRSPFLVAWQFQVEGQTYEGSVSSMDSFLIEPLAAAREVIVLHDSANPRVNTVYVD